MNNWDGFDDTSDGSCLHCAIYPDGSKVHYEIWIKLIWYYMQFYEEC